MEPNTGSVPIDQESQLYAEVALPTIAGSTFIRVLHLIPDTKDSPLAATLEKLDLSQQSAPHFNALSYVWGQRKSPADKITCNGHNLAITASCHDALQVLRDKHGSITIWVDAICINQMDDSEKARQVPLMQRIYSEAKSVYIWLGHGNTINSHGLELIRSAASLYDAQYANHMINISKSWIWWAIRHVVVFPWNWLRVAKNLKALREIAKQEGSSVEQLNFDYEWLHRAWTCQEFMLAESPVFLYGTTEVSMKEMSGMLYFEARIIKSWITTVSFKDALSGESTATSIGRWKDVVLQWREMRVMCVERDPRPRRDINAEERRELNRTRRGRELRFGYHIMNNLRGRHSTHSHDHVYSIHGILQTIYKLEPPPAGYNQPLDLVYRTFFQYLITCDSSFINLIADSGLHQAIEGAPSWLPDWSKPSASRSWLATKYLDIRGTALTERLEKKGFLSTTIGEIEIHCQVEELVLTVSATDLSGLAFCDTVQKQYQKDQTYIVYDSGHLAMFERVLLVLDVLCGWLKTSPSIQDTSDNDDRVKSILDTVTGRQLGFDDAFIANALVVHEILPLLDDALRNPEFDGLETTIRTVSKHIFRRIKHEDYLLRGLSRIYDSIQGKRSIFTTESGEVGSGPPWMEVGDRIVYIVGVGLPMALRPHEKTCRDREYFSIVGPVHFPRIPISTDIDWTRRKVVHLV